MTDQQDEIRAMLVKIHQVMERLTKLTELTSGNQLLLSATDAAHCLGISRTLFYELMNRGQLPRPIRFGKRLLWSVMELKQWITAGCPTGDKWELIKKQRP